MKKKRNNEIVHSFRLLKYQLTKTKLTLPACEYFSWSTPRKINAFPNAASAGQSQSAYVEKVSKSSKVTFFITLKASGSARYQTTYLQLTFTANLPDVTAQSLSTYHVTVWRVMALVLF